MAASAALSKRNNHFSIPVLIKSAVAVGATLTFALTTLALPAHAVGPNEVEVIFPVMGVVPPGGGPAQPVVGATMELAVSSAGTWTPLGQPWSTCVVDAAGNCTLLIPDTYMLSHASETWRIQPTAASRWWLYVPYAGSTTGQLTVTNLLNSLGRTVQQNSVHIVAPNPALTAACSLNVSLVMDLSGSMSGSEASMISAANAFVDALTGTDTTFTVYSFSDVTPAPNGTPSLTTPTSVRTPAGAAAVKGAYAGWTANGGTNYAPVLNAIIGDANPTDVIIFMTDGAPNDDTAGIHAANNLKLGGTRIIGFGVGIAGTIPPLAAISGPTVGSEYFLAANFAEVTNYLQGLISGACTASLSLVSREAPRNQDKSTVTSTTGTPAPNWQFTAEVVGTSTSVRGVTDATGQTTLAVPVASRTGTTKVRVTQTAKTDWEVLQQSSATASCFLTNDPTVILPTANDPTSPGSFFLDLPGGEAVTCVMVDGQVSATQPPPTTPATTTTTFSGPPPTTKPTLPVTGRNSGNMAMVATVLLGAGFVLVALSRRRLALLAASIKDPRHLYIGRHS